MSKRRLDDTAALAGGLPREGSHTRSVRKIDNGHIVTETHYGPDGPGYHTEKFVGAGEKASGPSSLRDAMDHVKGK